MESPRHRHLLIVEDDERLRYLMQEAAERCGQHWSVETAADGQAAADYVRAALRTNPDRVPDLIVSDLSMPRMDGLELLREMKRDVRTRSIPFVIFTSSNRPNDREDAMAGGCCAFFNKPSRFDDFILLMASLPGVVESSAAAGVHAPGHARASR